MLCASSAFLLTINLRNNKCPSDIFESKGGRVARSDSEGHIETTNSSTWWLLISDKKTREVKLKHTYRNEKQFIFLQK
jgi:hypothetical protein